MLLLLCCVGGKGKLLHLAVGAVGQFGVGARGKGQIRGPRNLNGDKRKFYVDTIQTTL